MRTLSLVAVGLVGAGAALDGVGALVGGGATVSQTYQTPDSTVTVTNDPAAVGNRIPRLLFDVAVVAGCLWAWKRLR